MALTNEHLQMTAHHIAASGILSKAEALDFLQRAAQHGNVSKPDPTSWESAWDGLAPDPELGPGMISDAHRLEVAFARMTARGVSARFGRDCCRLCFPTAAHHRDIADATCVATCRFHPFDTKSLAEGFLDLQVYPREWHADDIHDDEWWAAAEQIVLDELTEVGLDYEHEGHGWPVRVFVPYWGLLRTT